MYNMEIKARKKYSAAILKKETKKIFAYSRHRGEKLKIDNETQLQSKQQVRHLNMLCPFIVIP